MALVLYGVFQMLIILVGRIGSFDARYMISSRYAFDTKFVLIGDLCIMAMCFGSMYNGFEYHINKWGRVVCLSCVILMIGGILYNDCIEYKKAPYRRIYLENMVEIMDNADRLDDEELAPLQADPNAIRKGVEIMKKYQIGIYKYEK